MTATTDRFRALHSSGTFVMPNPFDVGTARLLATLGFPALATTSAGFAATLGRVDMSVTRDELVQHVAALASATDLPLNVDAERCFAPDANGIGETVEMLAAAGAAGFSIEDWDPDAGRIDEVDVAASRVRAAADEAGRTGLVLTARCENHLHGVQDLDDTITRLRTYLDAGADALYAPGLARAADIERVVAIGAPVNILLLPGGPTVSQLADLGVRRISLGSWLATIAQGAVAAAATTLLETGGFDPAAPFLANDLQAKAFMPR